MMPVLLFYNDAILMVLPMACRILKMLFKLGLIFPFSIFAMVDWEIIDNTSKSKEE